MPPFKVVIPARFGSTRLPGKPLLPIAGRPMIARVCDRALEAGAGEIVVAVDDERIGHAVADLPVRVLLTCPDHQSGTERLIEVAQRLAWDDSVLVINLQGDEPLLDPALLRQLADRFHTQQHAEMATIAAPIADESELFATSAVKVLLDRNGCALYFSRAPIPWFRDGFARQPRQMPADHTYWRHIGLYAYTVGFLRRYASWPSSPLEQIESLEQLRVLWAGEKIYVMPVDRAPEAGIDTPEDLARVERVFANAAQRTAQE